MKKVINFTKYRFLAFLLSFAVLVAGIIGVVIKGEFNLGIDFVGGLSQRIQFAPVAFSLTYEGSGRATGLIQNGAVHLSIIENSEEEKYSFPLAEYNSVEDLASAIGKIDNIKVDLESSKARVSPAKLLPTEHEVVINMEETFKVNIGLTSENEIVATKEKVIAALSDFKRLRVQMVGNEISQEFILKIHMKDITDGTAEGVSAAESGNPEDESVQAKVEKRIKAALGKVFEVDTILFRQQDFTGPSYSKEIFQGSIFSIILVIILILGYISFRFKFSYAIAAVAALIHDVSIMIVFIGAFQLEVTSTTIAAILTIFGYSLNDTIVVFDRVRENFTLLRELDRESIINTSITQSLSRTLITSITTLLAVVAIYVFASGVIKDFAFNLIIGIVVGTYSSVFIAAPIVLTWLNVDDKRKKARQELKIAKKKAPVKSVKASSVETQEKVSEEKSSSSGDDAAKDPVAKKKKKKKKK